LPVNCRVHSNPLGCNSLSIPIRETRYLRSFGDLASANNPPKPSLTKSVRQHTANEICGLFFGHNDILVAISTDGFVVAKDVREQLGTKKQIVGREDDRTLARTADEFLAEKILTGCPKTLKNGC